MARLEPCELLLMSETYRAVADVIVPSRQELLDNARAPLYGAGEYLRDGWQVTINLFEEVKAYKEAEAQRATRSRQLSEAVGVLSTNVSVKPVLPRETLQDCIEVVLKELMAYADTPYRNLNPNRRDNAFTTLDKTVVALDGVRPLLQKARRPVANIDEDLGVNVYKIRDDDSAMFSPAAEYVKELFDKFSTAVGKPELSCEAAITSVADARDKLYQAFHRTEASVYTLEKTRAWAAAAIGGRLVLVSKEMGNKQRLVETVSRYAAKIEATVGPGQRTAESMFSLVGAAALCWQTAAYHVQQASGNDIAMVREVANDLIPRANQLCEDLKDLARYRR